MLSKCLDIMMDAANGAWAVFERIYAALPGSVSLLVVLFFVGIVISLIIMPIRGGTGISGASSDEVRETETRTFNHRTGKWNHTTSYSTTRRHKK